MSSSAAITAPSHAGSPWSYARRRASRRGRARRAPCQRRVQQADHQVQHHDEPEMHGIDAIFSTIGIRIGTRMVIAAMVSRKQPTNSNQQVHEDQEHPMVVGDREDQRRTALAPLRDREQPGEDRGRRHDEQARSGCFDRVEGCLGERLHRHRAIAHRPRKSDHITAATAASVGVNQPRVMPPIRMTASSAPSRPRT